ncbi:peptidase M23 [Rhodospirillum rubrum]|uniref:peptidoglycan DD-metalloendopeptidase family protein n=1 Tax=Rhodospirillum rubrum TaxID=1085 RepID=UPI001906AD99|nr:peptidoglycan DD-metalloendopeptidase family protein [Rhodospirillum rubrum]MBK1664185.1 peptidase M23 [Rhodospirillum rubrum]MBK1675794.1 peptidase M23 [Rhodospirillum rubrum]
MSEFDPQDLNLTQVRRLLRRHFPDRHLMVRSDGAMRQFTITGLHQIGLLVVALGFFGWVTYATAALVWMDDILSAKNERIDDARDAYKALLAEVGVYKEKVVEVTHSLQGNHAEFNRLLGTGESGQAAGPPVAPEGAGNGAAAGVAGGQDADFLKEQKRYDRERQTLMAQLATLQQGMEDLSKAKVLLTDFDGIELEMRKVVLQRDLALAENQDLLKKIRSMESTLLDMKDAQKRLVDRFGKMAQQRIGALEEDLSATGLDVASLLRRKGKRFQPVGGQGGPFLPVELPAIEDEPARDSLDRLNERLDRWGMLNALIFDLPLAAPLATSYRINSPFGVREDPVNGRLSRHEGLDMGAPMDTPVSATGPGKVVYAGWRGRYGRVVEIDHGMGLSTRYAHLRTIKVQLGQSVGRGDVIGALGNSGRSTGPHLHYEVRVNGNPRNPTVFLKAGKNVFEG